MSEPICYICGGIGRGPHSQKEQSGEVNHKFSENGDLVPVQRGSAQRPSNPQVIVAGAIDAPLRRLLIKKGILTDEDFSSLLDPGTSTSGD